MRIINLGGATAILEHRGKRMLFDPWLDDGIFHGAWNHYPPLALGLEDVGPLDYIYISHIHEDHCSAGTLRALDPGAEVLIMDRRPNFVARFLDRHDFRFKAVHLIPPRTPTHLGDGLWVDMLEADPGDEMAYMVDSALILRWDDFVLYNANDCQPYPGGLDYVKERYGSPDLALLPYSGGSGYPACYSNLDEAQKCAEKARIIDMRLEAFAEATRVLAPRHVMPFADQYVVAGSRAHLNRHIAHPSCPGAVAPVLERYGLADGLLLLNPGQSYDFDHGRRVPEEPYRFHTEAQRLTYAQGELGDRLYDHERLDLDPGVAVDRLVAHARARLWSAQARQDFYPEWSFYLDVSDTRRRFHIRLDCEAVEEVGIQAPLEAPYLRVSTTHTLMVMLLIGHVSWNIADAALFLDYERVPNTYDPQLYVLLNLLKV